MSQIEGGTSGGPVVDSNGDLLGVVSFTSEDADASGFCDGSIGFAPRCLPLWLLEVIDADDSPTEGESSETFNSSQNSLSDLPLTP